MGEDVTLSHLCFFVLPLNPSYSRTYIISWREDYLSLSTMKTREVVFKMSLEVIQQMEYVYTQLGGFTPNQEGVVAPCYTHTSYTQSVGGTIPQGMVVSRENKGVQVLSDKLKRYLANSVN